MLNSRASFGGMLIPRYRAYFDADGGSSSSNSATLAAVSFVLILLSPARRGSNNRPPKLETAAMEPSDRLARLFTSLNTSICLAVSSHFL